MQKIISIVAIWSVLLISCTAQIGGNAGIGGKAGISGSPFVTGPVWQFLHAYFLAALRELLRLAQPQSQPQRHPAS